MKREDVILLILAILLLAGMLLTIFLGGEQSRHGVGGNLYNPSRSDLVTCTCQQIFHPDFRPTSSTT